MLCCIRRTKPVEKNEDAEQKIEPDANKPEDKAHKAATKIQASFRGHIIRKKLKTEKKEENATVPEGSTDEQEKKEKASPVADAATDPNNKEGKASSQAKSPDPNSPDAPVSSPGDATPEISKEDAKPEAAGERNEVSKDEEKEVVGEAGENKTSSATVKESPSSNECAPNPQLVKSGENEEDAQPKQANVPAANHTESTTDKANTENDLAKAEGIKDAVEETKPSQNNEVEAEKEGENADKE